VHEGEEGHARPGWTTSRRGQDSSWKSQSEWQRTEINGESSSMVWQDFNWHDASRGPSAIAELLVQFTWNIPHRVVSYRIVSCKSSFYYVCLQMIQAYKYIYIKEDQEHNGRTISQNGLVWRELSCCGQLKTDQDGGGSSMKQPTLGVRTVEDRTGKTSTNEIRHACLYTAKFQSIDALRWWFVFRPTKGRRLNWPV